ncbi:MAG: hypothetical protein HND55_07585 [Pseudomonadota bacterium]|nr:MAG: hypothetical protein HND55_07585 [Pseudomonadota bacterium]
MIRVRLCLLMLGLILAAPAAADQPPPLYRIEVIVFTHADGQPDRWPVSALTDFSHALDPSVQPPKDDIDDPDAALQPTSDLQATLDLIETLAELESSSDGDLPADYPEPWQADDELGDAMAAARRRLEQSDAVGQMISTAWFQPLSRDVQAMAVRLHDDVIVAAEWIGLRPTGQPVSNGRAANAATDLAPRLHYRLDGTIRLRQRQFLHCDVSLHWRVPESSGPLEVGGKTGRFELHALEQSRTVEPERVEYFDSPWLGVLVHVEAFEPQGEIIDAGQPAESPGTMDTQAEGGPP